MEKINIVCPHCFKINAIPKKDSYAKANCGSCKKSLLDTNPVELDESNFDHVIVNSDIPVIVDFWAPWCTYCRRIAPAFDKIASQQEDKLIFAKLDIDDAAEIAEEYGVDTIPTLIIFKNGEVLGSIVAPDSKAKIEAFIEENL